MQEPVWKSVLQIELLLSLSIYFIILGFESMFSVTPPFFRSVEDLWWMQTTVCKDLLERKKSDLDCDCTVNVA